MCNPWRESWSIASIVDNLKKKSMWKIEPLLIQNSKLRQPYPETGSLTSISEGPAVRRCAVQYHMTAERHQLKCLRLSAGRLCQSPDLHQTNQPKQTLYGKQFPRELLFQLSSLSLRPHRCEMSQPNPNPSLLPIFSERPAVNRYGRPVFVL